MSLLGVLTLLFIAWILSARKDRFPTRLVVGGVLLQLLLAFLLLRFPPLVAAFDLLAGLVSRVISFADHGILFLFGDVLGPVSGPNGFVFAIHALCVIIYFASLMAVLYHIGLMQRLVAALAWLLRRTLNVTGTEALVVAANVFVGQTEAPLCVRPLIERMTRSQLMTLMVGGFATIAGSVLAVYVALLGGDDPDSPQRLIFVKHFITASVLSAPAAFVIAKILEPETETPVDEGLRTWDSHERARNILDAAAQGATEGLKLALNVGAMLIAFVALLALLNWPIEAFGEWGPVAEWREARDVGPFSLQGLFGWLLSPLAFVMGVPWNDCPAFGSLLGQKIVLTEFVAYRSLSQDMAAGAMSDRTAQIAAYALCGFANFPSIAIQIGGLSALAPKRRADFASLGLRAMLGGALASWLTACIAALFIT